eukprot:scaffold59609_cov21-Tisochrysis_lutea.AAC.3
MGPSAACVQPHGAQCSMLSLNAVSAAVHQQYHGSWAQQPACSARAAGRAKAGGAQLMPTEPELLADAQNWVDKWPGAVGHTNMLSSYLMADAHWNADC